MRAPAFLALLVVLPLPLASAQAAVFTPLWSTPVPEVAPLGPPLAVAATFDGVLVGFDDGSIHSFDRRTGEVLWRTQTEAKRLTVPLHPNGVNLFYVGGDHKRVDFVYILSGEMGYWDLSLPGEVTGLRLGGRSELYAWDGLGNVVEVATNDGTVAWSKRVGAPVRSVHFDHDDMLLSTDEKVFLYELGTGELKEQRDLAGVRCVMRAGPTSEVFALRRKGVHRLRGTDYLDSFVHEVGAANCGAMDNERLWVPTAGGTIASLEQDSRTKHWETARLGDEPNLTRILPEGLLLVTANGGAASGRNATLHVVDHETGRVLANHTLQGHEASPPVRLRVEHADGRAEDTVFVRTDTHVQAVTFLVPDPKAPPPQASTPTTTAPSAPGATGESETPGSAGVLVLAALVGAAAWRRRRG